MNDVTREIKLLEKVGWKHQGLSGGHHVMAYDGASRKLRLPLTPSDVMWIHPSRQEAAKAMGISRPELEIRMGIRSPKRDGEACGKPRRKGEKVPFHLQQARAEAKRRGVPAPKDERFVTAEDLGLATRGEDDA